jgi:hypothetical protein
MSGATYSWPNLEDTARATGEDASGTISLRTKFLTNRFGKTLRRCSLGLCPYYLRLRNKQIEGFVGLVQAQANAAKSDADLQRATQLIAKEDISRLQYDQAIATATANRAAVASAQAGVHAAEQAAASSGETPASQKWCADCGDCSSADLPNSR